MSEQSVDTLEAPAATGTALVTVGLMTPAIFQDPNKVDDLLTKLEKEVLAIPRDISTETGREAIRSLAYKVARSKTALDEMGRNLVEGWKKQAGKVDAERRKVRERCDKLRDAVRQPLTDWEEAEAKRVAAHEEVLAQLLGLAVFGFPPTSAHVRDRLVEVEKITNRDWQEFAQRAAYTRANTISALQRQLAATEKAEADRAELERLHAEKLEREQRERDEKIAAEAAERARIEAETKARRQAEEVAERAAAEQRRVEREREEAIQRAVKAEQDRADAITRHREAEERAAEAAAKAEADRERAAEEAEAKAWVAAEKAEADRVAAIEAERARVAEARAVEERAAAEREANKNHCRKINNEARDALIALGLPDGQSTIIITAIARGEIPHVSIIY